MDIKEALANMDSLDDDQWTTDGSPKLDAVSSLVGEKVSRQDVIDAAPEFSRENMVIPTEGEDPAKEPEASDEEVKADISSIEQYLEGEPLPVQEFIPFLMSVDPMALEILDDVITEQIAEADAAMSRAEDLKVRLKASRAYTRNRIKAEVPDVSNQQAIQQFIKSQTQIRGAKVEKTREVLKGVDLKSLDPRAAIDRAMSRKTGRGGQRPSRPLMGR